MTRQEKALKPIREITSQTKEASVLLTKVLDQKGNGEEKYSLQIREISEVCNAMVRQTAERLKHSFGSAFDREDIYALVLGMSTVVQRVEVLATSINQYQPGHYTPEMIALVDRIRLIVLELDQLIPMIKRPRELQERLGIVQGIQRESQDLYRDAVGKLFRSRIPTTDALMYKNLYDDIDAILERCRYVSGLIELTSIKQA